ncbi:MAG: isoleucine--tRNA ligase [Gemmatimonadales bacterium]
MSATIAGAPAARYQVISAELGARELEEELLRKWDAEDLAMRSMAPREGAKAFVFFEGPPTANGRPGIHHVFSRTLKDLFCRHRAMLGFDVSRKAGWDTHGLPVEIEVEKALGISGKQDIERIGVEEFNRLCRDSVWKYREDWERLSARMGYWLDYRHPYVTYTNEYVESVWWALKTLHARGLLYQGHKILPYCPRCGTALSSHEVAQGYEDVEDPSVYVALDLEEGHGVDRKRPTVNGGPSTPSMRRRIVVWTTTPWTLVSNAALAVHPDLTYIEVRKNGRTDWTLVLAEARASAVLGQEWTARWEVLARFPGSELAGQRYRRPLDWVPYGEGAHEVIITADFVSAEDGSGVVHMSPAFGADDYAAGQKHGLAFLQPVNARGEFPAEMPVVGGRFVKDADAPIIEELRRRDVLWKAGTLTHSYPHCWRCRTPLLYYARTSWFVKTTQFRDRMLARNAAINWVPPEMGTGRFGQWLENNIDWAISRDRYWGTPLPVWVNDADPSEVEVIGSYEELARRVGAALPGDFDPHKPYIDRYTWPAKSGSGTMRRVSEVVDAWFDSGSMPFAQWHYPFENGDAFRRHFPADFIAEGVDQTRGWFYSMLAIATGLGQELEVHGATGEERSGEGEAATGDAVALASPYRNVVVNDLVLDADGQKMSKSRGNTVDPMEVMERHGADAVRLFLVTASQIWKPRSFDESVIRETAGRFLVTLKNLYSGVFAVYANFGWEPSPRDPARERRTLLDQWVLSRLAVVEAEANRLMRAFDATGAARLVMEFVDEDVSKWYVRRSRERFYDVGSADNRAAFATLHEVLVASTRLLAPIAPFVTDWIHRELTGESVHLAAYVRPQPFAAQPDLDAAMREVRALVTLARSAREAVGVKVRQPLERMVCVTGPLDPGAATLVRELAPLLAAELNVKRVEFASSSDALVTLEAKPNFRALGKKWGKETPRAASAVAALSSATLGGFERGEQVIISVDGTDHALAPDDLTVHRRASGTLAVQEDGARFAAIDPTVTPALRAEGIARELVSRIQRLRKESGLAVSDRIRLRIAGPEDMRAAVNAHRPWMAGEVLAREIVVLDVLPEPGSAVALDLDGQTAHIALTRDS